MKKTSFLLYGIVSYVIFFVTYCYAAGFVTNLVVPTSLDRLPNSSLSYAFAINLILLSVFAVQHSVMARPWFKKLWVNIVPEPIERSTYVLLSSLCLILLFWLWQPMGIVLWSVESETTQFVLTSISFAGFGIVLISTFLINHFDLFGLRQVWLFFKGKPYTQLSFKTPFFYNYVRHPLYLGWMIAFWAAPQMTIAHFMFALICTGYMLTAIQFEEYDLVTVFGEKYVKYKESVAMLIPFIKGRSK